MLGAPVRRLGGLVLRLPPESPRLRAARQDSLYQELLARSVEEAQASAGWAVMILVGLGAMVLLGAVSSALAGGNRGTGAAIGFGFAIASLAGVILHRARGAILGRRARRTPSDRGGYDLADGRLNGFWGRSTDLDLVLQLVVWIVFTGLVLVRG